MLPFDARTADEGGDAQPAPGRTEAVGVLALCALLYAARCPDAFTRPQLFVEDGVVFYAAAFNNGLASLLEPYAGYHVLLQRLLALIALPFPVLWAPTIYIWSALAVFVAVAAMVLRCGLPRAPWLAFAMALVPHPWAEAFGTITNVQWIGALGMVVAAISARAPAAAWGRLVQAAFIGVMSLTGPFSILFLPLYLGRLIAARLGLPANVERHHYVLAAIVVAGACWQMATILGSHRAMAPVTPGPYGISEVLFFRLVTYPLFAGQTVAPVIGWVLAAPLAIAGLAAWALVRRLALRWPIAAMVVAATAVLLPTAILFLGNPALIANGNADRYFYIPQVMMAWIVVTAWSLPASWSVVLLLPVLMHPFQRATLPDRDWQTWAARVQAGHRGPVPINGGAGDVWMMDLRGR